MKKIIGTSITFILTVFRVNTQFLNNLQPGYNPGYYQPQRQYYEEYDHRKWGPARQGNDYNRRGGGRLPEYSMESNYEYDRPTKCKCSCTNCENLRPCCVPVCENCNAQSNLVFVPYPVPLVVSIHSKSPSTNNTPSTVPTKTAKSKTPAKSQTGTTRTSTTPPRKTLTVFGSIETSGDTPDASIETHSTPIFDRDKSKNRLLTYRDSYELSTYPFFDTNKRPSLMEKKRLPCFKGRCKLKNYRKIGGIDDFGSLNDDKYLGRNLIREREYFKIKFPSESNWAPRYGIIPIPDKLAMKFMTHMRDVKLHENKIR